MIIKTSASAIVIELEDADEPSNKFNSAAVEVIAVLFIANLSVGTLETIKKMPDYNEALEALKKEMEKKAKMNEKKFETLEELQKEKEKKNK